ncbi:MAG: Nif3-like dinuclear metal center hexameric protein [Bacteroidia bacterium]|nr:Nif3-like dinuclear metal center hexameric protein [Bacteroidia bacterium]
MQSVADILNTLLRWAPSELAWEKDNIGLLVGSPRARVTRVLVCLDITEHVIAEAVDRGADLIVAHHPVIFRPLYALRTDNPQGRMLGALLRNGIAVIAMHTNADAAPNGLNHALAARLDLVNQRPLEPARDQMRRVEFRLTAEQADADMLGRLLKDEDIESWYTQHTLEGTLLLVVDGQKNAVSRVRDLVNEAFGAAVLSQRSFVQERTHPAAGIGIVGDLPAAMEADTFLEFVKQRLGCERLRVTPAIQGAQIQRVAVCGGAGSSYVRAAIASGAQCFVTGDLTHHTFLDYGGDILLVDAGHFETEQVFVELCAKVLESASFQDSEKISILQVRTNTNPVRFV